MPDDGPEHSSVDAVIARHNDQCQQVRLVAWTVAVIAICMLLIALI